MYHVALELTQEQVKQLRLLATKRDRTVQGFVSSLVVEAIESAEATQVPATSPSTRKVSTAIKK